MIVILLKKVILVSPTIEEADQTASNIDAKAGSVTSSIREVQTARARDFVVY